MAGRNKRTRINLRKMANELNLAKDAIQIIDDVRKLPEAYIQIVIGDYTKRLELLYRDHKRGRFIKVITSDCTRGRVFIHRDDNEAIQEYCERFDRENAMPVGKQQAPEQPNIFTDTEVMQALSDIKSAVSETAKALAELKNLVLVLLPPAEKSHHSKVSHVSLRSHDATF